MTERERILEQANKLLEAPCVIQEMGITPDQIQQLAQWLGQNSKDLADIANGALISAGISGAASFATSLATMAYFKKKLKRYDFRPPGGGM
jgi:DNA replication protein DnaD